LRRRDPVRGGSNRVRASEPDPEYAQGSSVGVVRTWRRTDSRIQSHLRGSRRLCIRVGLPEGRATPGKADRDHRATARPRAPLRRASRWTIGAAWCCEAVRSAAPSHGEGWTGPCSAKPLRHCHTTERPHVPEHPRPLPLRPAHHAGRGPRRGAPVRAQGERPAPPSLADPPAFFAAVDEVAASTARLMGTPQARTALRTREQEAEKTMARGAAREARAHREGSSPARPPRRRDPSPPRIQRGNPVPAHGAQESTGLRAFPWRQ